VRLTASEPEIRRAVAATLACLYWHSDERLTRLEELLPDDVTILRAMVDAAVITAELGSNSHEADPKGIAPWIKLRLDEGRFELIELLYETFCGRGPERSGEADRVEDVAIMLLSELSDLVDRKTLLAGRDAAETIMLFCNAQRGLPTATEVARCLFNMLRKLQIFSQEIGNLLTEALSSPADWSTLSATVRDVLPDFKVFGEGSLNWLLQGIRSDSPLLAYTAARLLGELGVSRTGELGVERRQQVAQEISKLLRDPVSDREVYDMDKNTYQPRVGRLYDTLFDALSQIVSGSTVD
jgi:hypothetical protein